MSRTSFSKQRFIGAEELSLSSVALVGGHTSASFVVDGFSNMKVSVRLTWAAATTFSLYLETSEDGSNWDRMQTIDSIAAGTITISDATYSKAVAASKKFSLYIPVCDKYCRLIVSCDGAGADSASIDVRLGTV